MHSKLHIFLIYPNETLELEFQPQDTIQQVAQNAGIPIICQHKCEFCYISVLSHHDEISTMTDKEKQIISTEMQNIRLACQIKLNEKLNSLKVRMMSISDKIQEAHRIYIQDENDRKLYLTRADETIVDIVHRHPEISIPCACEGALACSTCHVHLNQNTFDNLSKNNDISDNEEDLLEFAPHRVQTSRLGCQFTFRNLDGITLKVPS